MSAVLVSQIAGSSRFRSLAIAQSLTPTLALGGLSFAIFGTVRRNPAMTLTGVACAAGLGAVVAPALGRGHTIEPTNVPGLTVAHANLLYLNVDRATEAVASVLAKSADVLALSEFTAHHERALVALGAEKLYPYRFGRTARRSEGMALWSRFPLVDVRRELMDTRPGLVATVRSNSGPIRIVFAHPDPPVLRKGLRRWEPSLDVIASIAGAAGPPTVIVADLNAARWHPPLRRLLGRGWRDAHEMVGRGLTVSWPTGMRFVPPFVRLDHALLGPDIEAVAVDDFEVPGSDHRGFVVTLSTATSSGTSADPATGGKVAG